eukprot:GHVN01055763.1.p1 GENE.GHVN01055763.1~~GHVN01055763.1.p1  ORF type:complete len:1640 (-),score=472.30 GHVN01055763.1:647-5290(-)
MTTCLSGTTKTERGNNNSSTSSYEPHSLSSGHRVPFRPASVIRKGALPSISGDNLEDVVRDGGGASDRTGTVQDGGVPCMSEIGAAGMSEVGAGMSEVGAGMSEVGAGMSEVGDVKHGVELSLYDSPFLRERDEVGRIDEVDTQNHSMITSQMNDTKDSIATTTMDVDSSPLNLSASPPNVPSQSVRSPIHNPPSPDEEATPPIRLFNSEEHPPPLPPGHHHQHRRPSHLYDGSPYSSYRGSINPWAQLNALDPPHSQRQSHSHVDHQTQVRGGSEVAKGDILDEAPSRHSLVTVHTPVRSKTTTSTDTRVRQMSPRLTTPTTEYYVLDPTASPVASLRVVSPQGHVNPLLSNTRTGKPHLIPVPADSITGTTMPHPSDSIQSADHLPPINLDVERRQATGDDPLVKGVADRGDGCYLTSELDFDETFGNNRRSSAIPLMDTALLSTYMRDSIVGPHGVSTTSTTSEFGPLTLVEPSNGTLPDTGTTSSEPAPPIVTVNVPTDQPSSSSVTRTLPTPASLSTASSLIRRSLTSTTNRQRISTTAYPRLTGDLPSIEESGERDTPQSYTHHHSEGSDSHVPIPPSQSRDLVTEPRLNNSSSMATPIGRSLLPSRGPGEPEITQYRYNQRADTPLPPRVEEVKKTQKPVSGLATMDEGSEVSEADEVSEAEEVNEVSGVDKVNEVSQADEVSGVNPLLTEEQLRQLNESNKSVDESKKVDEGSEVDDNHLTHQSLTTLPSESVASASSPPSSSTSNTAIDPPHLNTTSSTTTHTHSSAMTTQHPTTTKDVTPMTRSDGAQNPTAATEVSADRLVGRLSGRSSLGDSSTGLTAQLEALFSKLRRKHTPSVDTNLKMTPSGVSEAMDKKGETVDQMIGPPPGAPDGYSWSEFQHECQIHLGDAETLNNVDRHGVGVDSIDERLRSGVDKGATSVLRATSNHTMPLTVSLARTLAVDDIREGKVSIKGSDSYFDPDEVYKPETLAELFTSEAHQKAWDEVQADLQDKYKLLEGEIVPVVQQFGDCPIARQLALHVCRARQGSTRDCETAESIREAVRRRERNWKADASSVWKREVGLVIRISQREYMDDTLNKLKAQHRDILALKTSLLTQRCSLDSLREEAKKAQTLRVARLEAVTAITDSVSYFQRLVDEEDERTRTLMDTITQLNERTDQVEKENKAKGAQLEVLSAHRTRLMDIEAKLSSHQTSMKQQTMSSGFVFTNISLGKIAANLTWPLSLAKLLGDEAADKKEGETKEGKGGVSWYDAPRDSLYGALHRVPPTSLEVTWRVPGVNDEVGGDGVKSDLSVCFRPCLGPAMEMVRGYEYRYVDWTARYEMYAVAEAHVNFNIANELKAIRGSGHHTRRDRYRKVPLDLIQDAFKVGWVSCARVEACASELREVLTHFPCGGRNGLVVRHYDSSVTRVKTANETVKGGESVAELTLLTHGRTDKTPPAKIIIVINLKVALSSGSLLMGVEESNCRYLIHNMKNIDPKDSKARQTTAKILTACFRKSVAKAKKRDPLIIRAEGKGLLGPLEASSKEGGYIFRRLWQGW